MPDGKHGTIEGGLLTDDFFESAGNILSSQRGGSATIGAQQLFTPPEVAEFIAKVLVMNPGTERGPTFDPTGAGAGNLLAPFAHRFGIEIDRDYARCSYNKILGDCQIVADLARAIGLKCRRIVANPPFGLNWKFGECEGRSAVIAYEIIMDILHGYGVGAMIVPERDFVTIQGRHGASIRASIQVPDLFGPSVGVDCVIFFFAHPSEKCMWNGEYKPQMKPKMFKMPVRALDSLVPALQKCLPAGPDSGCRDDDDEFEEAFTLLQQEFREREKAGGQRRSSIKVTGKTLRVYLSPFEKLRLAKAGNLAIMEKIVELNGQSIFQFAYYPKRWRQILAMAQEGDLVLDPAIGPAYIKSREQALLMLAPMMKSTNPIQRLGGLTDVDQIRCIKDDPANGLEAGKTYEIGSCTTSLVEFGTLQRLKVARDPRTGQMVETIVVEDTKTERKGKRFCIAPEISCESCKGYCGLDPIQI
jgi:hypothetical protein